MKRGGFIQRKTPLRPVSCERTRWNSKYTRAKAHAPAFPSCARCGASRLRDHMEPHHPFGRLGERILAFVWVCGHCHDAIHDEGQQSRALGFLQPEFDGRTGEVPRPWPIEAESRWPSSLKREAGNGIAPVAGSQPQPEDHDDRRPKADGGMA